MLRKEGIFKKSISKIRQTTENKVDTVGAEQRHVATVRGSAMGREVRIGGEAKGFNFTRVQ